MDKLSYRRHRFPSIVIQQAVWLYFRFALSYRDVEDMLAERGIDVSYETVRRWALKFDKYGAAEPCAQSACDVRLSIVTDHNRVFGRTIHARKRRFKEPRRRFPKDECDTPARKFQRRYKRSGVQT
jgi:hypothetical protein